MTPRYLKTSTVFVLLAVLLLSSPAAHGATLHVSPFGSNTPPYSSFATAARDPRDAFAAASGFGDTVLIHAGSYDVDTTIDAPSGLTIIGVGADSTFLISRHFREAETLLRLGGDNELSGLLVLNEQSAAVNEIIGIWGEAPGDIEIHDCILGESECYGTPSGAFRFHRNVVIADYGNSLTITGGTTSSVWDNRFSRSADNGGYCVYVYGTEAEVYRNTFDVRRSPQSGSAIGVDESSLSHLVVHNNLILGGFYAFYLGYHAGTFENNTTVGTYYPVVVRLDAIPIPKTVTVRNNAFFDCKRVPNFSSCLDCRAGASIIYVHNSIWPRFDSLWHDAGYVDKLSIADSANFVGFPMLTPDPLYRLQAGSPLINAGDPSILDADGSRSDIGWTGGPNGVTYEYADLAPLPPDTIVAGGVAREVNLWWPSRPESDLAGYHVYRGSVSGFWHLGLGPVAELGHADTTWAETLSETIDSVFYLVGALDSAGHESSPSPEARYLVGDHPANRPPVITAIPQQDVRVGDTLIVPVSASDPDGDAITLRVEDLPTLNASFTDSGGGRGVFTFTPDTSQIGAHAVRFTASDALLADTLILTIDVHDTSSGSVPTSARILRVYPNPMNGSGVIEVAIPNGVAGATPVEVVLLDLLGRRVAVAYSGTLSRGIHSLSWDVSDGGTAHIATGVYFLQLHVGSKSAGPPYKIAIIN